MTFSSVPASGMPVNEITSRVRITDLFHYLGGPKPKRGRGPAFWRRGDNQFAVSLNDAKGTWYDFVEARGGGLIDLVRVARGVSKADALSWLAEYAGVPLQASTPQERFEAASRLRAAEGEARRLVEWKRDMTDALRKRRENLLATRSASQRFLNRHREDDCIRRGGLLLVRLECAWTVQFTYDAKLAEVDRMIATVEGASFETLLPFFRFRKGMSKAA